MEATYAQVESSVVPRIGLVLPSASDSVAEVGLRAKPQESNTFFETKLVLAPESSSTKASCCSSLPSNNIVKGESETFTGTRAASHC